MTLIIIIDNQSFVIHTLIPLAPSPFYTPTPHTQNIEPTKKNENVKLAVANDQRRLINLATNESYGSEVFAVFSRHRHRLRLRTHLAIATRFKWLDMHIIH